VVQRWDRACSGPVPYIAVRIRCGLPLRQQVRSHRPVPPKAMSITAYLDEHSQRHIDEWIDFVRIPSISAKSEHRPDMERAAQWLVERMLEAGLETAEMIPTSGHPVVVGEWRGAPGAPTLLVYGHYDVQPPEPLDEWKSPPFEPEIRNGRLYGRGTTDDKGQAYLHLKAVEAHIAVNGKLPVNVVFIIEGEEEVGSPNLPDFLLENRDRLACNAVLISDTSMFAPGLPSITIGLRGLAYMEVHVQGSSSDLHSGEYGGAVRNPGNALARIIAGLHDEEGRITIPGFYDDVRELSEKERDAIRALPFEEEEMRASVGSPALRGGERGLSVLERLWTRPTLDVNGLLCGYTGEGAKTVLPARAMAKISMRLVPDQDFRDVERKFAEHVQALAPEGVEVRVEALHGGPPWYAEPRGNVFDAARDALAEAFGREPVFTRGGGSIPIVQRFEQTLGVPVVLLGFGLPGDNLHAPNESMVVDNYSRGIHAVARLYERLDGAGE
jgi:acetylornithine deacetylase/succinyl-diaminopimelate desuccinylase-like protein